jgi:hypothetical protein
LRSVTNESSRIGTGPHPRWFFLAEARLRAGKMTGILMRAATVLLGVTAYVALGIVLASAG